MRASLLIAVVCCISVIGLFNPLVGLNGYIWYALMRPDIYAFAGSGFPFSLLLAVSTIVGSLRYIGNIPLLLSNPIVAGLLILQVPITLSVLVNPVPTSSAATLDVYVRMIAICILIPLIVQTEWQFRQTFLVVTFSLGLVGAKYGLLGLARGGVRITQGHGGMMSGNNELGLAFVMITPFCWYARDLVSSRWCKALLSTMAFGNVAAIVFTYSRAAALALAITMLLFTLRSKRKWLVVPMLALVAGGAVLAVSDTYLGRLATIRNPEEEASAESRIAQTEIALEIWRTSPLFGVGFGGDRYRELESDYVGEGSHVVHNTYLQILVESGVFACAAYVLLLLGSIIWLEVSSRRAKRWHPALQPYPIAMQTALIGFAVDVIFHPRIRYDFYYILIAMVAAWYFIQGHLQKSAEESPEASVEEYAIL